MSEDRFIDLESRLAHQDQLLNELNEVVTQQQAQIMQLETLCNSLTSRVRSIGDAVPDSNRESDSTNEKPPHY